ncbi:putative O-glycosylation ligase, exosortase A system-associated [bacterium]|jgi:probable O-glycosylation ligase (exosortase A-associated)|nr:putative O-glycosylation ligase, exosortase A system-associated [bacterium]
MRDIALIIVLPFMIYAIFQRPFIGLGMWIWTAMFFPNGWVYGIASNIRYNLLFTGLTVVVYLMSKQKMPLRFGYLGVMIIFFFLWTTLSTIFGLAPSEIVWEFWTRLAKIMALFVFILLIMNKKLHIDFFLWCLTLSLGFVAVVEGLKYVVSVGGHRIAGMAGHVIGDRNDLALAMTMLLPICFYQLDEYGKKSRMLKFGLVGVIVMVIISIIGTNSRGGLVALLSVGAYLFIKSEKKVVFSLLAICLGLTIFNLIPEQWFDRMNTISTAGSDDSFMGRIVAWKLSMILALRHPFLGGGFKALEYFPVWTSLSMDFFNYPFFFTGTAVPDSFRSHAAHSIYFQVLGDHGFIGLFIFLIILTLSFHKAGLVAKIAKQNGLPSWIIKLATMLKLSIFVYAVGGAALSFAYFDFIYAIFAIVLILELRILPELLNTNRSVEKL